MPTFTNGHDTAVIILHEIYGINRHIRNICARHHALGRDVYCPDMLGTDSAFPYERQEDAYAHFTVNVGFGISRSIAQFADSLKRRYRRLFLVGYSVGATVAWLSAGTAACDGIVCHYGTRIRDHLHAVPHCPALLILADGDAAFPARHAEERFATTPSVTLEVLEGGHGFCDTYGPEYHPESAEKAWNAAERFLKTCCGNTFPNKNLSE